MLGPGVKLYPVHIQNLSELERAHLQEIALCHLEERELHFKIAIPRECRKRRKSLRKKFDSFSKDKKEREKAPKAFGIPLSQVIVNDRAHKQRQDALKDSRRDCLDLEASVQSFRAKQQQLSNSLAPSFPPLPPQEPSTGPHSATPPAKPLRSHRRGGLSVDCISDLVESQSRLLEALQLSHPYELDVKKAANHAQAKLSLNPIYRQVPRVLEQCCRHIETYGLRTLGIFRVGSSKKRIRQLREDFDQGLDVVLDAEHSVHDIAALLKEFLRDMPDPLLPRELYSAFLHTNNLRGADQISYLQHLLYLLPPCNCDTLLRLLTLLHTVQRHAQDSAGPNDQKIPGNKMTAMNLAVIFGPNLLQRERGSERELRATNAEDSATIIAVTLLLISKYRLLFMVSAALQQEVLLSLLQTDPDIINYLLRRKLSGDHQRVETEASRGGVPKASLDSVGLSRGAQSPLDSPTPFFPDSQADSDFSSKAFLRVLQLNQSRKRSTMDKPQRSIAQIRQFHSHHNLMSMAQPMPCSNDHLARGSPGEKEPLCERGAMGGGFSPAERTVLFSLGLDPDTSPLPLSPREKSQSTHFWDFFSRKASSSENTV